MEINEEEQINKKVKEEIKINEEHLYKYKIKI